MTVSSGFFNSVNHDRLYDAEQLSSIFDGVIVDGVYENVGEAFNVTAYPDAYNTVLVGTGRAWFDHTWTLNDSRFSITLDPPNEMLGRIDAIVIDVNKERDTRKNSIIYLRGDEATPDFPPALINTENHHQYPIAYITRHAEQNGPISQSDIEITVGTGACPIATGVLEAQNLENLMQQLDAEFNEWWEGIKDLLDENTAANLQNQIDEINEKLNGDTSLVGLLEKPIAEAFMSGDYGLNVTSYSAPITESEQENHNTISFLPNGEICSVTIVFPYSADYENFHTLSVTITKPDGTHSTQTSQIAASAMQSISNSWSGGGYSRQGYSLISWATLIDADVNSYPAKFVYLATKIDLQSSSKSIINTIITVQISSAGTIQIDYSTGTKPAEGFPGDLQVARHPQLALCRPVNCLKLSDSSIVVPMPFFSAQRYSEEDTFSDPAYCVSKITSELVIQQSSWGKVSTKNILQSDNAALMYIPWQLQPDDNTKGIAYIGYNSSNTGNIGKDFGSRYLIDCETLTLTDAKNAQSTYPPPSQFNYNVAYGAETYALSEKNGVTAEKVSPGGLPTVENEKKSSYFAGASNLGGPLPEGTFIAANEDGRLYGISSSGEQIAIGTNGGAAILKEKKSIASSIDISKIVFWLKGYINTPEFTSYLMINGKPESILSYEASSMDTSYGMDERSGFVVKISKGV